MSLVFFNQDTTPRWNGGAPWFSGRGAAISNQISISRLCPAQREELMGWALLFLNSGEQ